MHHEAHRRVVASRIPMYDKLEVRVKRTVPFSRDFSAIYGEVAGNPKYGFKPSLHYLQTGDLRQFGYSSVLHHFNKHGKDGNHKLELVDTGKMGYSHMIREIESVFDCDGQKCEVMRLDTAADIEGVPVPWFHDRMRVKFKQWHAKIGTMQFSEMGKREMQTLYYGKRPNTVRVYDKVAEYRYQYARLCRKPVMGDPELIAEMEEKFPSRFPAPVENPDSEIPPFEEIFGVPENGYTLTRIERVIAGGRVPEQMGTVSRLRNGMQFNPFEYLEISKPGARLPSPDLFNFETYCAGMFIRSMFETEQGMQWVTSFARQKLQKNFARDWKKFAAFLPESEQREVTIDQILDSYRASLSKQLAA